MCTPFSGIRGFDMAIVREIWVFLKVEGICTTRGSAAAGTTEGEWVGGGELRLLHYDARTPRRVRQRGRSMYVIDETYRIHVFAVIQC